MQFATWKNCWTSVPSFYPLFAYSTKLFLHTQQSAVWCVMEPPLQYQQRVTRQNSHVYKYPIAHDFDDIKREREKKRERNREFVEKIYLNSNTTHSSE